MSIPLLTLENGTRIALGDRLGRGGEGDVYAVASDPTQAIKLYTVADLSDRREKVRAMVRANLASTSDLVAFPAAMVNKNGRFAGFTMRKITGYKALHELYSPGARKSAFPGADYRFLVRTAANIARAVGAVHETGCVIGDINHSGILVSDTATVALIDADSFQYADAARKYVCKVGVPEYTPPELQGVPLHSVARQTEHDRFGLAVVIFQLLFMGRHPFSGAYTAGEMPIERAIGEHRFAYSRNRKVGMRPPPAVPTLVDMPPPVAAALEAAFAPQTARPDARQWVRLLSDMEQGLRNCSKSKLHHYSPSASECPWCRMEGKQAIVLFLPHASDGVQGAPVDPGAAGFNLSTAWNAIQSVSRPTSAVPEPRLPSLSLLPTEGAVAARSKRRARKVMGICAFMAAAALLVGANTLWPVWIALGWFGLSMFVREDSATAAIRKEKAVTDRRFEVTLNDWRHRASDQPFQKLVGELAEAQTTYSKLPEIERQKIADYQRNRRGEQLKAYLENFLIRRQKIKGIGSGRVATLLAYGIETALDISEHRIMSVPGFGPKTASSLIAWRRQLESRFVYNERPNSIDTIRLSAIKSEMVKQAGELRQKLLAGPAALTQARAEIEARRHAVDPQLVTLHRRREQLAADLAA